MGFGRKKSRNDDAAPRAFRPFVPPSSEGRSAVEQRPVEPVRIEPIEPDIETRPEIEPTAALPPEASPSEAIPSEPTLTEATLIDTATDKPLFETPEGVPPPLEEVVGPWEGWRTLEQTAESNATEDREVNPTESPREEPPDRQAHHEPSVIAPTPPSHGHSSMTDSRERTDVRRSAPAPVSPARRGKVSLVDMVMQGSRGPATAPADAILSVRNLTTCFRTDAGIVTAVDDVSFDLRAGETLAIVGESGCGKTVTSKSIMRLLPPRTSFIKPGSEILFRSQRMDGAGAEPINLASASEPVMRRVRGARIAMIFQEPMTSLNPVFTVGWQINEALKYHTDLGRRARKMRAIEMLKLVDIPSPERRIREYPHQLSGGMRQRVMIAIALCCEPDILIADEPTTALDVTIQAQILSLMADLKHRLNTAIIFITHNLGVVAQFCDRVMVMYAGRVIESGTVREVFHHPRHPYARALLDSIPRAGAAHKGHALPTIEGIVPSLLDLPKGCRFSERCRYRQDRCVAEEPQLERGSDGRLVRCFYPLDSSRVRPVVEART